MSPAGDETGGGGGGGRAGGVEVGVGKLGWRSFGAGVVGEE